MSRTGQAEPRYGAQEGTKGSWERKEGGYCGEKWRERNKDRLTASGDGAGISVLFHAARMRSVERQRQGYTGIGACKYQSNRKECWSYMEDMNYPLILGIRT